MREFSKGRIITVFGCGGDRDRGKRPIMGKISTELSDFTIITSDNPRGEDPEAIIREIEKGAVGKNYMKIPDRQEAIKAALSIAKKGDAVLIAGKGHETYQIIGDKKIHFDDREIAKEFLYGGGASDENIKP
jgi:UDP-N-acetylmuramoyl-L-alanyl-D-glutamate--2,6-diaminopimelate ligase